MRNNEGPAADLHADSIALVEKYCSELLIHAADVEGLCQGIDEELVERLGEWASVPCTYAGGAKGEWGERIEVGTVSQCEQHVPRRSLIPCLIPFPTLSKRGSESC